MPRCNTGEDVALWGELNLSESRQILKNELKPSVSFPANPWLFPFHLSPPLPPLSTLLFLSSPFSVTFSSCHQYGKLNIPLCLWLERKEPSKQVNVQGVIYLRIFMSLYPLFLCLSLIDFQVSHVLNVAYGVTNLFPDQVVYKTLQILDLPETDLLSHLEECSSYIDQAKKQVHFKNTHLALLLHKGGRRWVILEAPTYLVLS